MRRTRLRIAVAVLLLSLLFAIAFLWVRHTHQAAFPIPPAEFLAQAERIRVGMTKEVARNQVAVFSEVSEEDGVLIFAMRPKDEDEALMGSLSYFIFVALDDEGGVAEVRTGDG
ncbi:hypothetical protein KQI84_02205 [bacterium]|nr:hypothetical protein [bacterium]